MKRIFSLLIILAFTFVMLACGGGPQKGPATVDNPDCPVKGEEQLKQDCPDEDKAFVKPPVPEGKVSGERYVFFYVRGEGKTRQSASEDADLMMSKAAAESIYKKVLSQMAKAWETYGDAESEQREQVTKGLIAQKSKVKVTGQLPLGDCVQMYTVVKDVQDCKVTDAFSKFIVIRRSGINYSDYQKMREKYLDGAKSGPQINETQKRLLNEADKALKSLDEKEGGEAGFEEEGIYNKEDIPE